MPALPLPQLLYLVGAIVAFSAFGLILLGVSLYTTFRGSKQAPVEREVTPAKHVSASP
jgi:hypothetical protein